MNPESTEMEFTGERFIPTEHGKIRLEHYHRYAMATEIIRDKEVLDVACGEGYGSFLMAALARNVTGVDIADEAVENAIKKYSLRKNLRFQQGNARLLEFPDASFDVVTSFETIEHLYEQEEMLSEINRVLRPDGVLVISSPNKLVYDRELSAKNEFHVKELTFEEFDQLLRGRFTAIQYHGQRVIAGSIIKQLQDVGNQLLVWSDDGERIQKSTGSLLPEPVYFLAVCCHEPALLPNIRSSVFYPEDIDLIRQNEITIANLASTLESVIEDRDARERGVEQLKELLTQAVALEEQNRASLISVIDEKSTAIELLQTTVRDLIIDRDFLKSSREQLLITHEELVLESEESRRIFHETIKALADDRDASSAELRDLHTAHHDLSTHVSTLTASLAELTTEVGELRACLAITEQQLNMERAGHQAAEKMLCHILKSRSWKVTKPLRFILRIMRGDFQGARRSIATFLGKPSSDAPQIPVAHQVQPAELVTPQNASLLATTVPDKHRILLVSYYCPTRAHAGGLRILDIYHQIRTHHPDAILELYTHARPSIDWEYSDVNNIFDAVHYSPAEELSPHYFQDLTGGLEKYDVIDLQFHNSADFLDQWREIGKKLLFTPMESVARNLIIDMSTALRGKGGITLRKLLASTKAAAEEIVFSSKADQVVCVSRTDASFLKLLCKSKKVTYLETAISSLEFADAIDSIDTPLNPEKKDRAIVYVAYFGSETNVVALRWYLQQVHPLVLEKVPDYKLQVVGRGDLSEFSPFASDAVELVGEVPFLAPHISNAKVGIAPSLGGSGFRGKVNQYAIFGVPSVISRNSAKGLDYQDSIDIFVADVPKHFAEKCATLLIDDKLNQTMGEKARKKAISLYSWESKLAQIRNIYSLENA